MLKIIFVCTGNTCRSPMAEYLFREMAKKNNLQDFKIISAGLTAFVGDSANKKAVNVLQEEDIDLTGHTSSQLTREMLEDADLVLTMTERHRRMIIENNHNFADKIFTLKGYAGENHMVDIGDPFGQSEDVYRKTRDEIKRYLGLLVGKLNQFTSYEGNLINMKNIKKVGVIKMKIALGSDHAGVEIKKDIIEYLKKAGYEYIDMGTDSSQSIDYPDYGYKVASAVADGEYDKGILICGTGIGMSITANKVKGIRAALCHDTFSARATTNHNNSNVLCMGARVIGPGLAIDIAKTWLEAEFEGGRHQRRIDKIHQIERGEYLENE